LGIAHRTIRISRGNISTTRRPRKAFPTTLETLGDCIYVARFEKGLLQSELAQKLQIPTTLVKRWEENMETPTETEWAILADLLNLFGNLNSDDRKAEN
jgi:ribosome-binding protein aMBF1 (putative translation factor)